MRCLMMAVVVALWSAGVLARDIAGVGLAEEAVIEGAVLKLNGAGVRSKLFIKIYVAGLYLKDTTNDPAGIISVDAPKRMEMYFLHDVDHSKLADAWREGFAANSTSSQMDLLADRILDFAGMFGDAREGDVFALDYLPGQGTRVLRNGVERGTIEGKDFNDALLRVWLGDDPVTDELKAALLGR